MWLFSLNGLDNREQGGKMGRGGGEGSENRW